MLLLLLLLLLALTSLSLCVIKDDVLPDGTVIERGSYVVYLPYIMGRMPNLWGPDAHLFNPSRHIDTATNTFIKPSPYVFTAFQAGPRQCLGQRLAHVEAKCLLAKLVLKYRWRMAVGEGMVVMPHESALTLSMRQPRLRLVFEERGEVVV